MRRWGSELSKTLANDANGMVGQRGKGVASPAAPIFFRQWVFVAEGFRFCCPCSPQRPYRNLCIQKFVTEKSSEKRLSLS